jgi:hypothetical protein
MKKEEVPQDDGKLLEGKFKVVKYAVDEEGRYDKVASVGWEPENVVMEQAWDAINQNVEHARQQFLKGEWSPLALSHGKEPDGTGHVGRPYGHVPVAGVVAFPPIGLQQIEPVRVAALRGCVPDHRG